MLPTNQSAINKIKVKIDTRNIDTLTISTNKTLNSQANQQKLSTKMASIRIYTAKLKESMNWLKCTNNMKKMQHYTSLTNDLSYCAISY